MNDDDYTELTCPMPDCVEVLFIDYSCQRGVYLGDMNEQPVTHPGDAHTQSWSVRCVAGHVVLLPAEPRCGCDDPEGPDCPPWHVDSYDWSDENRVFRPFDWTRLRTVLSAFASSETAA